MAGDEMVKKIDELYENEEFRAKAGKCQTIEEIIDVFKAEGIEITKEDFDAVEKFNADGELSVDDLDKVAGGFGPGTWIALGVGAYCVYKFTRGYIDGAANAWGKYCR